MSVPEIRLRALNDNPRRENGDYVLYWMTSFRRTRFNHSLDRALELSRELARPLVVLEALRVGYRWASDRLHRFAIDGMADNRAAFADTPVAYHPYVEPEEGAGRGLLAALAERACVIVTDDFPSFFLPRMQEAAARKVGVRMETVDGNGLYPLRATKKIFARAVDMRRHLQKDLPQYLNDRPHPNPLADLDLPTASLPDDVGSRWPAASDTLLEGDPDALAALPIDHAVPAVDLRGGQKAGYDRIQAFVERRLGAYGDGRNHPDEDAASGLSPYLHWGHVSAHEVFWTIANRERWSPDQLSTKAKGSREGWWNMSEAAESFMDELITWRELGFNMTSHRDDYDQFDSLPDWAKRTMAEHADDERPYVYDLATLEAAETHDDIWNAAQRELRQTGRMHNYLRMLWGKKIYEWSATPQDALDIMIELNNKYALDGRNPNSYSGIFWVLGRYDRAWGPERPIFGKLRYMTSDSTRRKLKL
ncbi:MAG: deoxyribodipyrimidine photolyase, partial [Myxococcota bacterium]